MGTEIKIGDRIPSFKVRDLDEEIVTDEDIIGSPFVLYFYPKDDTPGCTQEACDFRDMIDDFEDMDVLVIGISPDSPESHRNFVEKHDLSFPLLSDEKKELAQKFGVVSEKGSIIRSTFLCDEEGIVQWIEKPVKVEGHIERVLDAIDEVMA